MTIEEMHQYFRIYGQQVGMQNVRAILPEEIDAFLNSAINEKIRQVLVENVTSDSNKILLGNSKIGNVNLLKNHYTRELISKEWNLSENGFIDIGGTSKNTNIMYITSIFFQQDEGSETAKNCRIIDIDELYLTLDDYCNAPSNEYPIAIIRFADDELKICVYIKSLDEKLNPIIQLNYIKNPNIVSLEENINCDLPDYIHNEIVQLAVQKYFNSVGSTTQPVE